MERKRKENPHTAKVQKGLFILGLTYTIPHK